MSKETNPNVCLQCKESKRKCNCEDGGRFIDESGNHRDRYDRPRLKPGNDDTSAADQIKKAITAVRYSEMASLDGNFDTANKLFEIAEKLVPDLTENWIVMPGNLTLADKARLYTEVMGGE